MKKNVFSQSKRAHMRSLELRRTFRAPAAGGRRYREDGEEVVERV